MSVHNDGETKLPRCPFCQRPILDAAFHELLQEQYHCEHCAPPALTLQQPYALSVQMTSRDELEAIGARLLTVSQPCAGAFHQTSPFSWSLTFWYDEISYALLLLLSSLQIRYSLDTLHLDEDTLPFRSGNTTPRETPGSLIKQILASRP